MATDMRRRRLTREQCVELALLEAVLRRCPDDALTLSALGDLQTAGGLFAEGLETDRRLADLRPGEPLVWYNLACSLALCDRHEEALDVLARAVELGYNDAGWMREDEDLVSLRADPRFSEILERLSGSSQPID